MTFSNTRRILTSPALAAVSLTCALAAQAFQAPRIQLPADARSTALSALGSQDLNQLLALALNSNGDTIELNISAAGVRRGKGGEGTFDVMLKRIAGGRIELWVAAAAMKTLGLDALSGLAVQGKHGGEATVVLGFQRLPQASSALQTMVALSILGPVALQAKLSEELDRLADQNQAARLAKDALDAAGRAKTKVQDKVADVRKSFDRAVDAFKDTDKILSRAKDKLKDAERECDKALFLSGTLKKLLSGAKSALNVAEKAFDKAKDAKNAWDKKLGETKRDLERAANKVKDAAAKDRNVGRVVQALESAVRTLRDTASRVTNLQRTLGVSLVAVSFERSAGLDIEGSAKDLGIALGDAKLDLSASTMVGAMLRVDLPQSAGAAPRFTVRATHSIELQAVGSQQQYGGFDAKAEGWLMIDAVFAQQAGRVSLDRQASTVTIKGDVQLLKTTGGSARMGSGVGRTVMMVIPFAEFESARGSRSLSAQSLRTTLSQIVGAVTIQDRFVLAGHVDHQHTAKGNSIEIEGELSWHDRGKERTLRADAASTLDYLAGQGSQATADQLALSQR